MFLYNVLHTIYMMRIRSISVIRRPLPMVRRLPSVARYPKIKQNALLQDVEVISYFTGKSIILFTMFYCSLNWMYYRNLRKKDDDDSI